MRRFLVASVLVVLLLASVTWAWAREPATGDTPRACKAAALPAGWVRIRVADLAYLPDGMTRNSNGVQFDDGFSVSSSSKGGAHVTHEELDIPFFLFCGCGAASGECVTRVNNPRDGIVTCERTTCENCSLTMDISEWGFDELFVVDDDS